MQVSKCYEREYGNDIRSDLSPRSSVKQAVVVVDGEDLVSKLSRPDSRQQCCCRKSPTASTLQTSTSSGPPVCEASLIFSNLH